jgi:Mrp family chromosome partitioning ATPase
MSKNFELLQRAGKTREIEPPCKLEPVASPRYERRKYRRSHVPLNLDQIAREECLRLVQQVFLLQAQDSPRVVVFAGIDHGNGCSRICVQTAEVLQANVRGSVCLVEANFRSPSLPQLFGTGNHYGLTDALLGGGPIRSFTKPVGSVGLSLMSSGALAANSHGLLSPGLLKTRFEELRSEFDFVVVDAPPLTPYPDALALAKVTDGLVLVLEAESTRREAAVRIYEKLCAAQVRILGAVLNKRRFPIPDSLYRCL